MVDDEVDQVKKVCRRSVTLDGLCDRRRCCDGRKTAILVFHRVMSHDTFVRLKKQLRLEWSFIVEGRIERRHRRQVAA